MIAAGSDSFARIRLLRSPRIGPASYRQLLHRFGGAGAALAALPELAARGHASGYRPASERAVMAEIAAVERAGARYLFDDAPDYPPLLRHAQGAPPILIARGDAAIARRAPVALVGARNASAAAIRLAREFACGLAAAGHAVVSGLARGIDGAAHRGALAAGRDAGGTVAVIACGIDIAYPPDHAQLQEVIARDGLLLTEMPPGTEPVARHFPARNRIIAGLAGATLVVEAAPRSGSLITARLAGELGREVMAIPGSPLDPRSHGCNALIRDGATLVQSVEDAIEVLSGFTGSAAPRFCEQEARFVAVPEDEEIDTGGIADAGEAIAALLSIGPVPVDELIRQSGLAAAAVQLALIELELGGRLQRHAGARVSLSG
ncbi:MAG: DNA-processing protein DprA [Sphingomonadales bacterium]|nr:DNA-processing protein DprA [Sphingomonadales bacterium]